MSDMKILIATDTFNPVINGVVTSVMNLYHELRGQGKEVKILTLSQDKYCRKEQDVYYLGSFQVKLYPDARGSFKMPDYFLEELIEWSPDVIHTQSEFFTYFFASKIAKKCGCPMIHTYHTMYEDYTHYVIKNKKIGRECVKVLSRMLLKKADAVVVPTGKVKNALQDYGIKQKLYQVPTGISLVKFEYNRTEKQKAELRASLGIKETDQILLSVGRIGREKRLDQLIHFCKEKLLERNNLKLVLAGDGPERMEMEKETKKLGLQDKVIFAGMIRPEEIGDYYQIADIYVNASDTETQGLTFLEAMANCLPLLCKKDDCLKAVLEDGYNGFFYESEEDFSESLGYLLEEESLRIKMGLYGNKKVQDFSAETFGKTMEWVYQTEIARKESSEKSSIFSNLLALSR